MITLTDVHKSFGAKQILRGVNLTVERVGEYAIWLEVCVSE